MSKWGKGKQVTGRSSRARGVSMDVWEYLHGDAGKGTHEERVAHSIPRAGAPPRIDYEVWQRSCVGRDVKCGTCPICEWETEANRWHDWSPWRENAESRLRLPPATIRPAFPSLDAALLAWWQWQVHGRTAPSATGPLLDLIMQGAQFSGPRSPKRDNALLRRSDDIVHIDKALTEAFAVAELPPNVCKLAVVARAHDVLSRKPTFAEIAYHIVDPELVGVTQEVLQRALQRMVKSGRRSLQVELGARGLIPMPSRASGMHWDIDCRRRALKGDG